MRIIKINAMWCPGCIVSKSIWNNIEKKYPDHEYISLDYDLDDDVVSSYNVGDILPVVIIESDGKEIKRIIGEKTEKEILKEVSDIL